MKPYDEKLKNELLARGLLSEEQSQKLSSEVLKAKGSLKDCAVRMGLLKEEDIVLAEADILGVSYLDLNEYLIDESVVKLVPEKTARTHLVVPVFKIGKSITVATADPLNVLAMDEVRAAAGIDIEMVMSTKDMIKKAIDQNYGVKGSLSDVAKSFGLSMSDAKGALAGSKGQSTEEIGKAAQEAPVIKFVNLMILQALEEKASDIHVEPEENAVRIRNRVDGILHEASTVPKKLELAIASRIKLMSKLDIAETRKPQDGKIRLKIEQRELDIRVSTFPTMHGENIVMRLLESSKVILGLSDLGFEEEMLTKINPLVRKAYGMILVTGPTGAGKTTTLYAALNTINTIDKNIITIEDPVEYQLPLVRQTQVNVKAGLTFASGLRSILRQDPDVILVGEIRDTETADIAIQAALTGHLVFSTMHTNDAAGAIARLTDMQIEPFLISSAVIGVLAQRLVRTVCEKCKTKYTVEGDSLKELGLKKDSATFYRGKGCPHCKGTGYDRRVGIFELLVMDEAIRKLILSRASAGQIKAQAQKNGMLSMRMDGIQKAEKGVTTLEEVLKVTSEEE